MKNPGDINILVGCEESQAVCIAFRKLGFNAFSCDLMECSGGYPEWHLQMDVFKAIEEKRWDCMIAFPPCTHLAVSGAKHFEQKRKDGRQNEGINFFMRITKTNIEKWCIENPVGIMSSIYRKPDQIIQPFYWGDKSRKSTCLWLKGLPRLTHSESDNLFERSNYVSPELHTTKTGKTFSRDYMVALSAGPDRAKIRSKTFPGIANAMANQWGEYLLWHFNHNPKAI